MNFDLDSVIRCLQAEQAKVAEQTMATSPTTPHDTLVHSLGIYAGLQMARTAIEKMHEEDEERRNRM